MSEFSEREAALAVKNAEREGRINGRYRCARCGMRSNSAQEAAECCDLLAPAYLTRNGRPRRLPHE